MYSFEGNYRRKPVQSLRGASINEAKENLLKRTQNERQKREDQRQRQMCATQIQAFIRGCRVRAAVRAAHRAEFDNQSLAIQKATSDFSLDLLNLMSRKLIFFYKKDQDGQRLTWMCQWLMKHRDKVAALADVVHKTNTLLHLNKILTLCCIHLRHLCSSTQQPPLAVPMRMLEVFLDAQLYQTQAVLQKLLLYVVKHGYFLSLRHVLEARVPDSLERSVTPPTPIAASILELIKKPLHIVALLPQKDTLRSVVLQWLCQDLLCQSYSAQIKEFLLPALAYGRDPFPFLDLLHCLLPLYWASAASSHAGLEEDKEPRKTAAQRYGEIPTSSSSMQPHSKMGTVQQDEDRMQPSAWLLYALLHLSNRYIAELGGEELQHYLLVLYALVPCLQSVKSRHRQTSQLEGSDSDTEDEEMDMETEMSGLTLSAVQAECFSLLNAPGHVAGLLAAVGAEPTSRTITAICTVCHMLMFHQNLPVHKARLMYSLAYKPSFLRNLWRTCISASTSTVTGGQTSLLGTLSRGLEPSPGDLNIIVPLLSMFCSLFTYSLSSLHDSEFYGDDQDTTVSTTSFMPFTLPELVAMTRSLRDACLGIIELAHPDSRPDLHDEYKKAFQSVGAAAVVTAEDLHGHRHRWASLFKALVVLVKQLYARDSRRAFCPPNHWLTSLHVINPEEQSQLYRPNMFTWRPFGSLSMLNPHRMQIYEEEGCPPLSTKEVRQLALLQELPFVVPFQQRVKIFHRLVRTDRAEQQGSESRMLMGGPVINLMVRRNFLYEDAFEKLSSENEPNLKLRMKVNLVNFAGLDEAGIDGGGLFREFITELLKTAFDPNRGFFKYTTDRQLYPNPQAKAVAADFTKHYYFLGRILGKALYENLLVELPFASFFLSKILSRYHGDVDIHHLASLDPDMYKNLLFLKTFEGDVADLGLDFTVTNDSLGEVQTEELKAGGKDIAVTSTNRIEYIHLMADYRLNKQIRSHCQAFRQGLADVVSIDWLRMFNSAELQVLISGAPVPIDLQDLKQHTNYSGGYTVDHPVIDIFWAVAENFTDAQRRALLKFVTSCSRPPLLGFKDLFPAFCIHFGGSDLTRLPTASTCMNLLKLPEFKDKKMMSEKLLYALESGAGFELS